MFRRLLLILLVIGFAFSVDINNCTAQVNLNESNTVYNVVADLNYTGTGLGTACLVVNATNVTLDCQNHVITGTNSAVVGAVFVSAQESASVMNCIAKNFTIPFSASNSNHTLFKSNAAYNASGVAAFYLNGNFNTTMDRNLAYNNTQYGFAFWLDRNSTVTNNNATWSTFAGFAWYGNGSSVSGNYAYNNSVNYYLFNSNLNNFTSNSGNYTFLWSILLLNSHNNTFYYNMEYTSLSVTALVFLNNSNDNFFAYNNISQDAANTWGVILRLSNGNTLYSNRVVNTKGINAVYLENSPANNISYNRIVLGTTQVGVYLNLSHGNGLYYNNVSDGLHGVAIDTSENNTVFKNYAYGASDAGFFLFGANKNNLTYNEGSANDFHGFVLNASSSNNLTGNLAYNNSGTGFYVTNLSTGNFFSDNSAFNNTNGISLASPSLTYMVYDNHFFGTDAYNNSAYGVFLYEAYLNTFYGTTSYSNNGFGVYLDKSNFNNMTDTVIYGNTIHGLYVTGPEISVFNRTFIYNQSSYLRLDASTVLDHLALGYNSSIGIINFTSTISPASILNLRTNETALQEGTIILRDSWVSMNDTAASDANVSADITLSSASPDYIVYRGSGFPTSQTEILTGSRYLTSKSCAGLACTFNVSGFSGYTLGDPGCLNLSDPSTWGDRIINDTGVLMVNRNTTLCRDHYYLDVSSASALYMNASNIFLDCNQSVIDGVDGTNFGIQVSNVENDTIGNCTITNYAIGFSAGAGTANIYFLNNTAHHNTQIGFRLQGSNSVYFISDIAYNNSNGFVFMGGSGNSSLYGCSAYNNSFDGFYSVYSDNNMVLSSAFYENLNAGLHLDYSNFTKVTDTRSYSNQFYGIQVSNSSSNLFANVTLNGNYDGFEGYMVSHSALAGSSIYDNSHNGFYVEYSTNINATGSSAVNNTNYGFGFRYSNYSYVANNYANGSLIGFGLTYSNHSSFVSNNATNSSAGFALFASYFNVLNGSRAYSNTGHGIYLLSNSNQNNFTTTTLSNNLGNGAYIDGSNSNIFQGVASSFNNNSFELSNSDLNYMYNVTSVDDYFHAFYVHNGADYSKIIDCSATSESSSGVYIDAAWYTEIQNFAANSNSFGFYFSSNAQYSTITNASGTGNAYGAYIFSSSSNTFTNVLFSGSTVDGFTLGSGSSSNNLTNITSHSNGGYGFHLAGNSNSNNFTNLASYNNTGFGMYVETSSAYNTFTNGMIYNESHYLYVSTPIAENNFTNLTLGYTNAIGLVNYPFLNITYVNLNPDRFLLYSDWVSLDDSDSAAIQANKTANITISTNTCVYVLKLAGFPTIKQDILDYGKIYPTNLTCVGSGPYTAIFNVSGFSGYAVDNYTACLNLSDPTTWADRIVNDSGILYVNQNTQLCRDHYYMDVAAGTQLLEMNASNIWLNCSGAIIDGVDDEGYGIYIDQKENNTIKDCNVEDYEYGYYVTQSPMGTIFDNDSAYSCERGFYAWASDLMQFRGSTAYDNSDQGFSLSASDSNNFTDCYAYTNAVMGFYFGSSDYNVLLRNNATDNGPGWRSGGFVFEGSDYNNLSYNRGWDNPSGTNFAFYQSSSNTLTNNTGTGSNYGVYIAFFPAQYNLVMNNTFQDNNIGMSVADTDSNTLTDNVVYNPSGNGIEIFRANYTVFERNLVYEGDNYGFFVWDCHFNNFTGNDVSDNLAGGAYAYESHNSVFRSNIFWDNGGRGLQMDYCNLSTLDNNTAYGNGEGIYLFESHGNVLANTTIHSNGNNGLLLVDSQGNNFTDTAIYNNVWYGINSDNSVNVLVNTLVHSQDNYLYFESGSWSNFTNLTLGYNATVGLINYLSVNLTSNIAVQDGYDIYLEPDWVSLNPSIPDADDLNVSAYITINNSACGAIGVLRDTGFPSSYNEIITEGLHYPSTPVCNGDLATFYVDGFSGYTLGQETTYLDFSVIPNPTTYGTNVNASCNASNSEVLLNLYANDTLLDQDYSYVEFFGLLSAGSYNITCNASGTENYTAAEDSAILQINKATPAIIFNATPRWSITSGQAANITCNTTNPEITLELWNATDLLDTGQNIRYDNTFTTGTYNFTCNASETENYTSWNQTNLLTVTTPSGGGGRPSELSIIAPDTVPLGSEMTILVERDGDPVANARVVIEFGGSTVFEGNTNTWGQVFFTPASAGTYEITATRDGSEGDTDSFTAYSPSGAVSAEFEPGCDGSTITVTQEVCTGGETDGGGYLACMDVPVEGAEVRIYRCQEGWETAGDPENTCSELVETLETDENGEATTYLRDGHVRIVADLRIATHFVGTTIFAELQASTDCPLPTEEIRINFDPACPESIVTVTGTVCEEVTIMQDRDPTTMIYLECAEDQPLEGMRVEIYCCPEMYEMMDLAIEGICTDLVDSGTTDSAGMFATDGGGCGGDILIYVPRMLDTHMEAEYLTATLPDCAECTSDQDCPEGYVCTDGECVQRETPPTERRCSADPDCTTGYRCSGGTCAEIISCATSQDCPAGHGCLDEVCYTEEEIREIRGQEGVEGEGLLPSIVGGIYNAIVRSAWLIGLLILMLLLFWFFWWKRRKKKRKLTQEELIAKEQESEGKTPAPRRGR